MKNYYYYFPPFSKQFYFSPFYFAKEQRSYLMYFPYKIMTKIVWSFMKYFKPSRLLFITEEARLPNNIIRIIDLIDPDRKSKLQINLGTKGAEQKTTIISNNYKNNFTFFKIGNSVKSKELIQNESAVLKELNEAFGAPRLLALTSNNEYLILETNYLIGQKFNEIRLNEELLSYIISINRFKKSDNLFFSHGDFCPWNLLSINGKITAIDWEMAGVHPLGYDLFTFIFQTNFILKPNRSNREIWNENSDYILNYFNSFSIPDPKPFLHLFTDIKLEKLKESNKDHFLIGKYSQLKGEIKML